MICLGTISDGRPLFYDAALYEFRLDRAPVSLAEVRGLDDAGHIAWLAPEQRDWMRRIDTDDLDCCNRDALGRRGADYGLLSPEEQVQADAKRDDSVLAGKIVDADPALVAAVADALGQRGVAVASAAAAGPSAELPEGMEPLAQLQKQPGRAMTPLEHFLMRRILKNDDREKRRRERCAERKRGASGSDGDSAGGADADTVADDAIGAEGSEGAAGALKGARRENQ